MTQEIEGQVVSGEYLVPLTPEEIQGRIKRIKEINIELDNLTLVVKKLFEEVETGRALKKINSALSIPNYSKNRKEIYYKGILIAEVPLEGQDLQTDLPKDSVGDLVSPKLESFSVLDARPSEDSFVSEDPELPL